jgi:hypothetical protein
MASVIRKHDRVIAQELTRHESAPRLMRRRSARDASTSIGRSRFAEPARRGQLRPHRHAREMLLGTSVLMALGAIFNLVVKRRGTAHADSE